MKMFRLGAFIMGPGQDLLFPEDLCFRLTFQAISESCHLETFLVHSGTRRTSYVTSTILTLICSSTILSLSRLICCYSEKERACDMSSEQSWSNSELLCQPSGRMCLECRLLLCVMLLPLMCQVI